MDCTTFACLIIPIFLQINQLRTKNTSILRKNRPNLKKQNQQEKSRIKATVERRAEGEGGEEEKRGRREGKKVQRSPPSTRHH
jgi:hypothetical protein